MMNETIKESTYVCGICGNDTCQPISSGPLEACPVCNKGGCYECVNSVYDVYNTHICKDCAKLPTVEKIIEKYIEKWKRDRGEMCDELKGVLVNLDNAQEEEEE